MVKIFAPATIANLTVGFDNLGLAVFPIDGTFLGDFVTCEDYHEDFVFEACGDNVKNLPKDLEKNLVYKAYLAYLEALKAKGLKIKKLKLTLEKNMPIGSGLGSSSCSSVAALVALNKHHDNALNNDELLKLMGQLEGSVSGSIHYDNVAPAFLGGLQLMSFDNKTTFSLPFFKHWYWVLAYPGTVVNTAEAREILPKQYSKEVIVKQSSAIANFINALYQNNEAEAINSMVDFIAEPYREQLLPNLAIVKKELAKVGVLKSGISGSGPTYYALCNNLEVAENAVKVFKEQYIQNENGFVHICATDFTGAKEIK